MFHLIKPETNNHWSIYYQLRWRVLRQPWGQPLGSERDELDATAYHLLALNTYQEAVGVGRLHADYSGIGYIRYMAVDEKYHHQGIGSRILIALEEQARQNELRLIQLNARNTARDFYLQAGYTVIGKSHTLYGVVAHTRMEKQL